MVPSNQIHALELTHEAADVYYVCEPCFTAASNMAPAFCFPAAKWGLVGTTTACISSVLMKGCKCLMACASIRSEADAIYMALDNRVSHGGYSV